MCSAGCCVVIYLRRDTFAVSTIILFLLLCFTLLLSSAFFAPLFSSLLPANYYTGTLAADSLCK